MNLGLKDRLALAAAASKGIGFAEARELAVEGARVLSELRTLRARLCRWAVGGYGALCDE
jgi:NAD(P)-dependent dehydrogenase (short-subunit alcohol dehydrogenase family)